MFQLTSQFPHDINIIANSDIAFNGTLQNADRVRPRECFAITRHEYKDGKVIDFTSNQTAQPRWSQDVWIFRGFADIRDCDSALAENLQTNDYDRIKFWLGTPGCDNLIARRIMQSGYSLKNPYHDIVCLHHHEGEKRPDYSHRLTGVARKWAGLQDVKPVRL